MEEYFKEKSIKLSAIIEPFDGFVYVCSKDYTIEFMNKNLIKRTGYNGTGQKCYKVLHDLRNACSWCVNERVFKGETIRWELKSPKDNRWYNIINTPVPGATGDVSKLGVIVDITQRKREEEELRRHRNNLEEIIKSRTAEISYTNEQLRKEIDERKKSEEALKVSEIKYRELVQNANSIILKFDREGKITFFNEYAQRFFGFKEKEILGLNILGTIVPWKGSRGVDYRAMIVDFLKHPEKYETNENENTRRNGDRVWIAWTNKLVLGENGKTNEILSIGNDITERKKARQHIHFLTHQLIKAQENERLKISRDLHDNIAQDLSTLKIGLETLFSDQTPELRKKIKSLSNILHRSIASVRNMSYDLRPPELDQLGLVTTLFLYCEEFSESTGIYIDFGAAGMEGVDFHYDVEINMYRLVQEALNNIKKHSGATMARIRLVASSPNIVIRIEDNGIGFDIEKRKKAAIDEKRMGLKSMEERVALLEGDIRIQSRPNKGVTIRIEMPMKEKAVDPKNQDIDN